MGPEDQSGHWPESAFWALAGARQQRRLDAVAHLELLQDVRHVVLDGLLAEMQLHADFFIAIAGGDPLQDLPLPLGKAVKRAGRMRTEFPTTQFEQETRREGWRDIDLAGCNRAHDAHELPGGDAFQHVSPGPGA